MAADKHDIVIAPALDDKALKRWVRSGRGGE